MKSRLGKLKSVALAAQTMKGALLLVVATLGLSTAYANEVFVSGKIQVAPRDDYWDQWPTIEVKIEGPSTALEPFSFETTTDENGEFQGTGNFTPDPNYEGDMAVWATYKYRSPTGIATYKGETVELFYPSFDPYDSVYFNLALPNGALYLISYELLAGVDTVNVTFVGFDEACEALNAPALDAIKTGKMLKGGAGIFGVWDQSYYTISVTSDVGQVEQIASSYWHEDTWEGNRWRLQAGATDTKFFAVKQPKLFPAIAGDQEHTTHVIITNGAEVTGGSIYYGQTAYAIYTADPGYVFAGGATAVTNTLYKTWPNTYRPDVPAAPFIPKAKIGGALYPSLSAANAAASAGDVITFIDSMDGVGVAASKAVTIDFAGYTYTFSGSPVGSPANLGLSFAGASYVLTNGTLTLSAGSGVSYILACGAGSSTVVSEMALGGDIALAGGNLSLVSGSLSGSLKILSDGLGDAVVTKTKGFAAEAPDGYGWTDDDPQVLIKVWRLGSEQRPWSIGATQDDTVIAWTNGMGKLIVEGAGKMADFAAEGTDVPWPKADVTVVEVAGTVTEVGYNASGLTNLKSSPAPKWR